MDLIGRDLAPRSLYVHVPFCRHRCGYCNFSLVAGRDHWIDRYLAALADELSLLPTSLEVDTLYIGGGTPSHLTDGQLTLMFDRLDESLVLSDDCEFTCECNPADMDTGRVALLRQRGVNRISLGVQSFRNEKLRQLDRDHSADEAHAAIDLIVGTIPRLSVDLIFGVRDETVDQWQDDVETAFSCGATHASTYGLTIEKGTLFFNESLHHRSRDTDEDSSAAMYRLIGKIADAYDFEQYEVSSFARPGHRCRHNQVYWSGQPYFAVGSGAASYVGGTRRSNHLSPITYTRWVESGRSPVVVEEHLSDEDRARELLVVGMRRMEGVEKQAFEVLTGYNVDQLIHGRIDHEIECDLILNSNETIRLTQQGVLVSDAIWPKLL